MNYQNHTPDGDNEDIQAPDAAGAAAADAGGTGEGVEAGDSAGETAAEPQTE